MHESHRRAEKGRGEKHIEVCRWFIDLCTRWGYVRGWHCNSLEPPSLTKLQFVQQEIYFFWGGHTITPNSKAISEKRIKAIKDVPKPITKKQLLSFLGMCAYCRTFIPNYAFSKALESPDNRERAEVMWQDLLAHRSTGGVCKHETATGSGSNVGPPCDWKAFHTDGRRSLHDFARTENITFINSPMAEVSHDFAWHAKCNGEKMHNFESCHTSPYRGGRGRNTIVVYQCWNRCVHHVQTCWTHL